MLVMHFRLAYHCSKSASSSEDQRQKACKYYTKAADFALGQRASTLAYDYCLAAYEMCKIVAEYSFLEKVVKWALYDLEEFTTAASERNASLSMTTGLRGNVSSMSSTSSGGGGGGSSAPQRQSSLSMMLSHFTHNDHPQSRDEIDKNNFHALLALIAQKIVQINMASNPNNTLTEADREASASTNNKPGSNNGDIKALDKLPAGWKLSYTESKPVEHKHSHRKSVIQGATDMLDKITNRGNVSSLSTGAHRRIPSEGSYADSEPPDSTIKDMSNKEKDKEISVNNNQIQPHIEENNNPPSVGCIIS